MSDQFTIEEIAKLSSAIADVRRLLDALRTEMAAMRAGLGLPPLAVKSRDATSGTID